MIGSSASQPEKVGEVCKPMPAPGKTYGYAPVECKPMNCRSGLWQPSGERPFSAEEAMAHFAAEVALAAQGIEARQGGVSEASSFHESPVA